MKIDVYIIKINTLESRLLKRIGFDREELTVVEWKGKAQWRGGYGKKPVAWRISGDQNIKKLCSGLIKIIEKKPSDKRSQEEQRVLNRAKKLLRAIEKKEKNKIKEKDIFSKRLSIVNLVLEKFYPSANSKDLMALSKLFLENGGNSINELDEFAKKYLKGKSDIWALARTEFINTLKNCMTDLNRHRNT